jgi:thiamine pyrophosphate-dependent acetolactate synthase large subunit-like protein
MDLGEPRLGFLDLARGLGLSAERITTPGELTGALSQAIAAKRPHLIEVVIEAKVA